MEILIKRMIMVKVAAQLAAEEARKNAGRMDKDYNFEMAAYFDATALEIDKLIEMVTVKQKAG